MVDPTANAPFIQAAHVSAGSNLPVNRVVIHGTVSPCVPGNARGVAQYFQSPGSGGSAHYVLDPAEVVQCVAEAAVAWHAPPNRNSIGVELSDPQVGDPARWGDPNHEAMLRLAAQVTRWLCDKYQIPLVKLSPADLLAGARGICGHVDVSNAWHQTDHTDPGPAFPWNRFMQYVTSGPAVTPTPAPPIEDDMFSDLDRAQLANIANGVSAVNLRSYTEAGTVAGLSAAVAALAKGEVTADQIKQIVADAVAAAVAPAKTP